MSSAMDSCEAIPERTVRIDTLEQWPGGVVHLVVKAEDDPELGSTIPFEAGRYAELTPPGGVARYFSFASAANKDGTAEFYIKLHENGYFSDYLRAATVGDELSLRGPEGSFGLRENGVRPRWMVCGGTGLAPCMSMLRQMAERGETQEALLIVGVNTPQEIFATDAMADLCARLPTLRTVVTVAQPDERWTGPVGTSVDVLDAELTARGGSQAPDIYLCGPPGFLQAAGDCAARHGVPESQIYQERA